MTFYGHMREDSSFVYGKLCELLELLNNNNLRFYVKNEKQVNLLREFKYQKKKRVEFVGILDYYSNLSDKESEFIAFPLIFNEDYEILHLGVSIFFTNDFSQKYKKGKYNYLELYIRNVETSHSCNTNTGTGGSNRNKVDDEDEDDDDITVNYDVLTNLRNLKFFSEQETIHRKILTRDNDGAIRINMNNNIYSYKGSHICIEEMNSYSQGNGGVITQSGIYKEESTYYSHSISYMNTCNANAVSHTNRSFHPEEELHRRNINSVLTENCVNLVNVISKSEANNLYPNDNLLYGKESEDAIKNGKKFCEGPYRFVHNVDALNNNGSSPFGINCEHLNINTSSSLPKTGNDLIESSKSHHQMGTEDKFASSNNSISVMGNILSENALKNEKNENCTIFSSGYHSTKGNRTYNEDRVINIENINEFLRKEMEDINKKKQNDDIYDEKYAEMLMQMTCRKTPTYTYCAIYDGHNGESAVNTVQKYLHLNIHLHFLNGNKMNNAIICGFETTDKTLREGTVYCEEDNHSSYSSGTTACVTIILKNMLYIGNIGDSRCVLSKNGRAVVLTVDHRVSVNKKEQERIISCGGTLDDEGYLGGCLGVCRGFGSFEKITKTKLKGLICDPDIFQIKLTDDDEFLIICCDGIFDVMTSQEAVNTVRMSLLQNANANAAAEGLCDLAYKRKSLDNLSAIVVVFQNPANKKKACANENTDLNATPAGRVRRRIKFSALKNLLNP